MVQKLVWLAMVLTFTVPFKKPVKPFLETVNGVHKLNNPLTYMVEVELDCNVFNSGPLYYENLKVEIEPNNVIEFKVQDPNEKPVTCIVNKWEEMKFKP